MWEYNTDYLSHHGIKGQKWGVRRYQNEDGTYTNEGKKRRNISDKTKNYIKIGAAAVGTAIAAYSAYKLSNFIKDSAKKDIIKRGIAYAEMLHAEANFYDLSATHIKLFDSSNNIENKQKERMAKANNLYKQAREYRRDTYNKASDVSKSVFKSGKYLLNEKMRHH